MLKQIGQAEAKKRPELWQNLVDCHDRIRKFTAIALKLGRPAPLEEVAEAAAAVQRYFTIALPLHAEDEDLSLAPRLRVAAPALAELLDKMSAEHGPIHQTIADLTPLWSRVIEEPARQSELAGRLRAPASWLSELFESHLRPEEEIIFPQMVQALLPESTTEILAEMRARRG
jgi:hypothetical protein